MQAVQQSARPDPNRGAIGVTLPDGMRVLLRPEISSDCERTRETCRRLSLESRYRRFWLPLRTLGDEMLARLTEADQVNHVAWCALDPDDDSGSGMGTASFWRLEDDHSKAEVSFRILDEFQKRGIGVLLLAVLCIEAQRRGIRTFLAFALGSNASVVTWFRALGSRIQFAGGQFEIALDLYDLDNPDSLPQTNASEQLCVWLRTLAPIMNRD